MAEDNHARVDIVPQSALAAVNEGRNIHIYFQTGNSLLGEVSSEDGENFYRTKGPLPTPGTEQPRAFTPLAAVSYVDSHHIVQRRLYYLTIDFYLAELAWTGENWQAGDLNNLKVKTASFSNLAAFYDGNLIRVFYQSAYEGNRIHEVVWKDLQWTEGATLPQACAGTKIAAMRSHDKLLRLYYQDSNFDTHETTSENDEWQLWTDSIVDTARTNPHSALAVLQIAEKAYQIRLYTSGKDTANNVVEVSDWVDPPPFRGWNDMETIGNCIPLANIGVAYWGEGRLDGDYQIRVYTQANGDDIQELRWSKEEGEWKVGSKIPTF